MAGLETCELQNVIERAVILSEDETFIAGETWLKRGLAPKPKPRGTLTYELDSSHVPMLSQPERVLDVIRAAAKAVQGATAAA